MHSSIVMLLVKTLTEKTVIGKTLHDLSGC